MDTIDLIRLCGSFAKMAETNFEFKIPNKEDERTFKTLISKITSKQTPQLVKIKLLVELDLLSREFDHHSYSPEFYDLISDKDVFEWLESAKRKTDLSQFDNGALHYICEDLKQFELGNIFNDL